MKSNQREGPATARRVLQYTLLYVLLVFVSEGLSGLLAQGWPVDSAVPEITSRTTARWASQVIVGIPALLGMAVWVRRTLREAAERTALTWNLYLVLASLTGLGIAAAFGFELAEGLTGLGDFQSDSLTGLLVWGLVWWIHFRTSAGYQHAGFLRTGVLLGSWLGLMVMGANIWWGLERLGILLWQEITSRATQSDIGDAVLRAGFGIVIGGLIWIRYWVTTALQMERDQIWRGAVWLAGVLAGLVTALAGAWQLIVISLEWIFNVAESQAADHFAPVPAMLALVIVGMSVWFYTRRLVRPDSYQRREEADRLHDYTGAGLGLTVAVIGGATGISALIHLVLPRSAVTGDYRLFLSHALALLAVGLVFWWRYWAAAQRSRHTTPDLELASTSRRIYLLVLLGLGAVVTLGSLLFVTFVALEDLLSSEAGWATWYDLRVGLAMVVVVGVVARYHQMVRRQDRLQSPQEPSPGVIMVVLVSAQGKQVAAEVENRTGLRVWVWDRPDATAVLTSDQVVAAIEHAQHERLLIVASAGDPLIIPFSPRA